MTQRIRAIIVILLGSLAFLAPAHAQDSARFLRNMPTIEQIEEAFPLGGDDPVDAAARQVAAFKVAGDVIAAGPEGRNGSLANMNPVEAKAYDAYSITAPQAVRDEMGWPRVVCAGNADCIRYDTLVTDYVWRDKKKSDAFRAEFREKLFAGKEAMLPDRHRYNKATRDGQTFNAVLTLVGGLVLGLFVAQPLRRAREGEIRSLGSGVIKQTQSAITLTYNSRNHITIGDKKLGTTVTSPRIDDALTSAMDLGGPVRVGIGWTFWRNWALCVRGPAETVREPFFSFVLQTFIVIPVLTLFAIVAAAFLGPITGSGHVAVFAMAFVPAYAAGQVIKNVRAWLA